MFKKSDGSLAFSWNRLVTNTFPNFALDNKNNVEMSPAQADSLFQWQIRQEDPTKLDELAFYAAGVTGALKLIESYIPNSNDLTNRTDAKTYSKRILKALQKNGVITPEAKLDLSRITKHLPNQLSFLDVHRQRKLVGMLFAWEEELMRWRLLDEEAAEIKHVLRSIDAGDGEQFHKHELETSLKAVEVKKTMPPSARHDHVAQAEGLPAYSK